MRMLKWDWTDWMIVLGVLGMLLVLGLLIYSKTASTTLNDTAQASHITLLAPGGVTLTWQSIGGVHRVRDCVTFLESETGAKMTACGAIVVEDLE